VGVHAGWPRQILALHRPVVRGVRQQNAVGEKLKLLEGPKLFASCLGIVSFTPNLTCFFFFISHFLPCSSLLPS